MKLLIDIPKKTIAHIRSDYGHGCKAIYDEDKDRIVDAIYHGTPVDDVKAEIADIYCGQYCENPLTADAVRETILDILDNIGKESVE